MHALKPIVFFLTALLGLAISLRGQNTWSLQKCIEYAAQNSLAVKQAQARIRDAELLFEQSRKSWHPSLNGQISGGYNFGRTIDPTTNSFLNQSIGFNSLGLNVGAPLYTGGQITNGIQQSRFNLEAAKLDAGDAVNNLSLNVALAYLNILLADEQLSNARKRLEGSRLQLAQTDQLIESGARPRIDRLNLVSQVALDEQAVIEGENLLLNNSLVLSQLMLLPPGEIIQVEKVPVTIPADANPDAFNLMEIYTAALNTQPQIGAGEKRLASAQTGIELARAGMRPSLNIFGNINANASTQFQSVTGFEAVRLRQAAFINGQEIAFEIEQNVPVLAKTPYFDQINSTFGQSIGLQLTVPIYNNDRNRIAVERARIGVINAEITNQQLRQTLSTNIQNAITSARGAKRVLAAAEAASAASLAAYQAAQERYTAGAANTFDLNNARLNLDRAQIDLIRAKYQYLFNLKQVDFYLGRPLTLN